MHSESYYISISDRQNRSLLQGDSAAVQSFPKEPLWRFSRSSKSKMLRVILSGNPRTRILSKQAFPRQFNLPRCLAGLETTFAHARHTALTKLDLVLGRRKSARAVMREMYAAEGLRAEIFIAVS
jgi:hypothetical protein